MAHVENAGENARLERDTHKEAVEETDQIRLVLLGRAGIGKSTLVSRVFDISESEAKVSHGRSGQHNIREGITYPSRPGIVVHDSGGFRGGANDEVEIVKSFLEERKREKHVKDQVHCIWYCIACEGERPVEGFGEEFLSNIDAIAGDIPVLIIFTKFDRLIGKHKNVVGDLNPDWPNAQISKVALGDAFEEFEDIYLKEVKTALKNCQKKWDFERVSRLQSPARGGVEKGDPYNETHANGLIEKVESCLQLSLRPMWVRTQQQNAKLKVEASIEEGMKFFSKAAFWNGIPLVPIKDLAVEMITANAIFNEIHRIWNEHDTLFVSDSRTQSKMRDVIFNKNFAQKLFSQVWDIFDITGPLSQANNAVKFMKTVVGVTLIHEQLFWDQKRKVASMNTFSVHKGRGITDAGKERRWPLNEQQVDEVIRKFQDSDQRNNACAHIDGKLVDFGLNLKKAYSKAEIERVIRDALKVSRE